MPRTRRCPDAKEADKDKPRHWWHTFQVAKHPAYVTLVEPPSLSSQELRQPRCRIKRLLLDDVLDDPAAFDGPGRLPKQIEITEGSFILILPGVEANENKMFVPPPWLCRVKSIWFLPGNQEQQQQQQHKKRGRAAKGQSSAAAAAAAPTPRYQEPIGTTPDVIEWEKQQLAAGRLAAQHFQLQVTYFYRWPDLYDQIKDCPINEQRFLRSLTNLGIADSPAAAKKLATQRGAGGAPPTHHAMRYVIFSNHDTPEPTGGVSDADGARDNGEEEDEEAGADTSNTPAPLESVMATANVLFLETGAQLPYQPAAVPARAAAVDPKGLPAAVLTRLHSRHKQLPHSFICNMFLMQGTGEEQEARLFGLQEWADGRAGTAHRSPAENRSRQLVKQLIAGSKQELARLQATAATAATGGLQQHQGHSHAAAAAAAADDDDGSSSSGDYDDELPSPYKKRAVVLEALSDEEEEEEEEEEDEEADGEDKQAAAAAAAPAAGGVSPGRQQQEDGEAAAAAAAAGDDDGADENDSDVVMEEEGSPAAVVISSDDDASSSSEEEEEEELEDAGGDQQQQQQHDAAQTVSSSSDEGESSDSSSGSSGGGAAAAAGTAQQTKQQQAKPQQAKQQPTQRQEPQKHKLEQQDQQQQKKKQKQEEQQVRARHKSAPPAAQPSPLQQQEPAEQRQQRRPQQQQHKQQQVRKRHKSTPPAAQPSPLQQQAPPSSGRQRPATTLAAAAAAAAGGGGSAKKSGGRGGSAAGGAFAARVTPGRRKGAH